MKYLFFLCLLTLRIFPQVEQTASVELYFGTESTFGGPITFYLSNQGQVWGGVYLQPPCVIDYYLTNEFDNPSYTITNHNQSMNLWEGMDFTTSVSWPGADVYGYGLYKVTNSESTAHFYIDYRDQRITCYPGTSNGHQSDLWIKYNATNNAFSYSTDGQSNGTFYAISNNEYLSFWAIKEVGRSETDQLPDFWEYALALIPSQSGNNPKLVWGPHPDDNIYLDITGYNIYRAIDGGSYSKIAEVNENTFSYIDTYFMLGGSTEAHYKVTANYQDLMESTQETSSTNTVTADVGLYKEISRSVEDFGFELVQNYPNPFNPTTNIQYSIPTDGVVSLIVYDLLGREVATLVNESKKAGNYTINFDASTLASGTYIYQLKAGEFLSSKKMLLIK